MPVYVCLYTSICDFSVGYAAVTQNNGQQKILGGGHVYLLTHRNWKFEKFVSMKIQTNILEQIEAPRWKKL